MIHERMRLDGGDDSLGGLLRGDLRRGSSSSLDGRLRVGLALTLLAGGRAGSSSLSTLLSLESSAAFSAAFPPRLFLIWGASSSVSPPSDSKAAAFLLLPSSLAAFFPPRPLAILGTSSSVSVSPQESSAAFLSSSVAFFFPRLLALGGSSSSISVSLPLDSTAAFLSADGFLPPLPRDDEEDDDFAAGAFFCAGLDAAAFFFVLTKKLRMSMLSRPFLFQRFRRKDPPPSGFAFPRCARVCTIEG